MKTFLIYATIIILFMIGTVSAGFGSTYLPTIDGTPTLVLNSGDSSSYFIYPQNLEAESIYVQVVLTDENNIVTNKLKDSYEIPANTQSDSFPIELKLKVPSNAELGQVFSVEYSVLTTKKSLNGGMVNFNPTGYFKKINVQVQDTKEKSIWAFMALGIFAAIAIIGGLFYVIKKRYL